MNDPFEIARSLNSGKHHLIEASGMRAPYQAVQSPGPHVTMSWAIDCMLSSAEIGSEIKKLFRINLNPLKGTHYLHDVRFEPDHRGYSEAILVTALLTARPDHNILIEANVGNLEITPKKIKELEGKLVELFAAIDIPCRSINARTEQIKIS